MSLTIKKLQIKNFLGVEEFGLDAAKINIFKGPKGSGKSSIIEGIEKTFENKNRRTEVIKHGEEEATLYIELNDGLEIDRRVRSSKADYLKCRKPDEAVPSTEKFLRALINGNIFRPLDWVNMSAAEQTKSILNMLQISWSNEDIEKWFGEIPSNVDFNQHILMILKAIEMKYYKDREEVNRQIRELKTQIESKKKELPIDYDGEAWRDKKIQEYYNKVSDAQKINNFIAEAKRLQDGLEEKIKATETNSENEKNKVKLKFKDQRQDIKDIIDLSNSKIEKSKDIVNNVGLEQENAKSSLMNQMEREIQEIRDKYSELVGEKMKEINLKAEEQKELISIQQNKIAAKEQELISLGTLEDQEIKNIDDKKQSDIDKEKIRVGKAAEYLEKNKEIDIEPLQKEADKVADMQSYLRQWDNMIDIRDNQLPDKERYSQLLTSRIEKARTLPSELLKVAKMPIDGISVDEKGLIRINGTLIDGLSDGEQLELAFKIAKAQAGELKLICLDRWESVKSESQKLLQDMLNDDYQYFITEHTDDKEFTVEKIG